MESYLPKEDTGDIEPKKAKFIPNTSIVSPLVTKK